jgi:hypothetical protein
MNEMVGERLDSIAKILRQTDSQNSSIYTPDYVARVLVFSLENAIRGSPYSDLFEGRQLLIGRNFNSLGHHNGFIYLDIEGFQKDSQGFYVQADTSKGLFLYRIYVRIRNFIIRISNSRQGKVTHTPLLSCVAIHEGEHLSNQLRDLVTAAVSSLSSDDVVREAFIELYLTIKDLDNIDALRAYFNIEDELYGKSLSDIAAMSASGKIEFLLPLLSHDELKEGFRFINQLGIENIIKILGRIKEAEEVKRAREELVINLRLNSRLTYEEIKTIAQQHVLKNEELKTICGFWSNEIAKYGIEVCMRIRTVYLSWA